MSWKQMSLAIENMLTLELCCFILFYLFFHCRPLEDWWKFWYSLNESQVRGSESALFLDEAPLQEVQSTWAESSIDSSSSATQRKKNKEEINKKEKKNRGYAPRGSTTRSRLKDYAARNYRLSVTYTTCVSRHTVRDPRVSHATVAREREPSRWIIANKYINPNPYNRTFLK